MLPSPKFAVAVRGLTASNGGTQIVGYVDTLGYDYLVLNCSAFSSDTVAANNPSTFKLGDSADTYVTNAADITAFVGGTAVSSTVGWVIPTMPVLTNTPYDVQFRVDCRHTERYIHLEVIPLTNMTMTAYANLFRAEAAPMSAANANVDALVAG